MKILIVDDSVFSQKSMQKIVREKYPNADIIFASSGEDGYHLFSQHNPDYIITDLLMPGIGGITMIKMIRKLDEKSKIIVISSDIQKAVKSEMSQLDIPFINKPLHDEKLHCLYSALES